MSINKNESSIMKFFRINFVGRPLELDKLVYDIDTLVENENEINSIVKAHNLFHGHQNISFLCGFLTLSFLIFNPKIKIKSLYKVAISTIPIISLQIYSYFVYWHFVKDIVLQCRKRARALDSKDNEIIAVNLSKDNHEKIIKQLGLFPSINITLNYYFGNN